MLALLASAGWAAPVQGQGPFVVHEAAAPGDRAPTDEIPWVQPFIARPSSVAALGEAPFLLAQVNVDERGRNIVGDSANEPSIAVDPTDPTRMAIGWRQFFNDGSERQAGWSWSADGGRTWTYPGVIQPGEFRSDPKLTYDANGTFYYFSVSWRQSLDTEMFISRDGGQTWGNEYPAWGGDKHWFTVDRTGGPGHGNIYGVYNEGSRYFLRSTDGKTFPQPWTPGIYALAGTVAVGPKSEVYVAGSDGVWGGDVTFFKSSDAWDAKRTPTFELQQELHMGGFTPSGGVPNPGGLLAQVWIDADRSDGPYRGNVYVLATIDRDGRADRADVMFIRSTDGGAHWSRPMRVNDDRPQTNAWQWFAMMAVAPSGRIDAVWNDTRSSAQANICELTYAWSTDAGRTWSKNVAVSPRFDSRQAWPRGQNKLGDYYDMISDARGAHVAFAATFNDEQDVYYTYVAPDCNGNGLHDGDDIAAGRSADANATGVPDECEAVACERIRAMELTCRNDGRLTAVLRTSLPENTRLRLVANGDERVVSIAAGGRARATWRRRAGLQAVTVAECPGVFRFSRCGGR